MRITKRTNLPTKQDSPCLHLYPKSESHLAFNHIPLYTNTIHKNNHKSTKQHARENINEPLGAEGPPLVGEEVRREVGEAESLFGK